MTEDTTTESLRIAQQALAIAAETGVRIETLTARLDAAETETQGLAYRLDARDD